MLKRLGATCIALLLMSCAGLPEEPPADKSGGMEWLAGDHHVHSQFSVGWRFKGEPSQSLPPLAQIGGDAINPIGVNATQARAHGLDWMVTTDHGGPFHSNIHLDQAYPDVLDVRDGMPGFFLFYGMEFDTPGADHASLIMPFSPEEADHLFYLESTYNKREPFPAPPEADQEPRMNAAVAAMATLDPQPVLIVNHISRSRVGGAYGKVTPTELRRWNDLAPTVVVGMEGSPGHQARAVRPDGALEPTAPRGGYEDVPTYGGFDSMTAQVGGFWDSMLGEGRRWWITATSDMHRHWRQGGDEFWPGEYSKTYVLAERSYTSILESIRQGRMFAVTGDLVSGIQLEAASLATGETASLGETLPVRPGEEVTLTFAFREPEGPNFNGDQPEVARVDVIVGEIDPAAYRPEDDTHRAASVAFRLNRDSFLPEEDGWFRATVGLPEVTHPLYIRVRGTSGSELEPEADPPGEDPWADLWFYTNPVFVSLKPE
ncbi:MAG: phosphoesterase [Hyphomonas sp.]